MTDPQSPESRNINSQASHDPRKPCDACGYYLIHSRQCAAFVEPPDDAANEYAEWTPPADAEDAVLHFEQWVEPWMSCFDCQAEPRFRNSLFAVAHHPGCMVAWLHKKLVAEWQSGTQPVTSKLRNALLRALQGHRQGCAARLGGKCDCGMEAQAHAALVCALKPSQPAGVNG